MIDSCLDCIALVIIRIDKVEEFFCQRVWELRPMRACLVIPVCIKLRRQPSRTFHFSLPNIKI